MRFFSSRPASKYSIRTARSRTRFISSRRRPNVIRAITSSTPGIASDATTLRLSHDFSGHALSKHDLSKRHHHFVLNRALGLRILERPLQPCFRIVELRHIGYYALEIDTDQLAGRLPQLEHHTHWRLLPRRLIERRGWNVVLAVKLQRHRHLARAGRDPERQYGPVFFLPHGQVVLHLHRCLRHREHLVRNHTHPHLPQVSRH